MSKLATAGTAALGGGAGAAGYARLVEETEYLLNRQRKKGKEYKLDEDPKRKKAEQDYIASILGTLEGGGSGSARAAGPPAKAGSPAKAKAGAAAAGGGGGADGAAPAVSLDAYDPKATAERELHELEETVRVAGQRRCCRRGPRPGPRPLPACS